MKIRNLYFIIGILSLICFLCIFIKNMNEYKITQNYYINSFPEYQQNNENIKENEDSNKVIEDHLQTTKQNTLTNIALDTVSLLNRNPDFIGWIRNNEINLPIVQTTDNSFYLDHNFDKEKSKYGSIFLDYRLNIDNQVLLLHGHNVNGNLMFGSLKKYVNEKGYFEKNKDFSIALSTNNFNFKTYTVENYLIVHEVDDLLSPNKYSFEEYKSLIQKYINNPSNQFIESDHIIVLSTCYGAAGTDKRLLLILI